MYQEHIDIVKCGKEAIQSWRDAHPHVLFDLVESQLARLEVQGANLWGADLRYGDYSCSNFRGCDLRYAHMSHADLSSADLAFANLTHTDLSHANLDYADLTGATLIDANLNCVSLVGANVSETILDRTTIPNVDFGNVRGLSTVKHDGPSSIGIDTLARTLRSSGGYFTRDQELFFIKASAPSIVLEYLPGMLHENPIQFYSCFISYSTDDERFADQLNNDLGEAGIKTWKWNLDAVGGRDLRQNIDVAIRNYDKLILVCSVNSLTSGPVEREIERALQKEDQLKAANAERAKEALKEGREAPYVDTDVLVPLRVDSSIFNWSCDLI